MAGFCPALPNELSSQQCIGGQLAKFEVTKKLHAAARNRASFSKHHPSSPPAATPTPSLQGAAAPDQLLQVWSLGSAKCRYPQCRVGHLAQRLSLLDWPIPVPHIGWLRTGKTPLSEIAKEGPHHLTAALPSQVARKRAPGWHHLQSHRKQPSQAGMEADKGRHRPPQ